MDPYAMSDTAWCQTLGRRLDELRQRRDLSRDQLGEEMGVSQPTLRKLLDEGQGKLSNLVAALRALEALDQLESFLKPAPINPVQLFIRTDQPRQTQRQSQGADCAQQQSQSGQQDQTEKDDASQPDWDLGW